MRRWIWLLLCWPVTSMATDQVDGPEVVPGALLVMLQPDLDPRKVASDLARLDGSLSGLRVERLLSAPMRIWLFHFDPAMIEPQVMLRTLRMHPAVQLAQFEHVISERQVPNDPEYGQQWHHQKIQSEVAWELSTGGVTATGDTIVVCILERVDLPHPDLVANAWYNHAEVPGNGIDDDGNGYVDDHRGWNVTANSDDVYAGAHGTRVAGMIGAQGDNDLGVVGANWNVKMMVVHYGSLQESNVVAAYTYPLEMRRRYDQSGGAEGAFVVATNASWGINNGQPADFPIWCAVYDSLGAAGVLSCGATANSNVDVDVVGDMPTACSSDYLISVTATNSNDMRGSAGYGTTSIDVAAPGSGVFTTVMGGGYGAANGTSFASPLTAGVVGLLYAAPCPALMELVHTAPAIGAQYVREMLFAGVDQVGNLPGTIATGGRINAGNSMQLIMNACGGCPSPFGLLAVNTAIGVAQLSWNTLPADSFLVRHRVAGTEDWTVLISQSTSLELNAIQPCTAYEFQVSAYCTSGESGFGPTHGWVSEGCCHAAPDPMVMTSTESTITVQWGTVMAALSYELRWRPLGGTTWIEVPALTGPQYTLEDLAACGAYQWQVRTTCSGEASEWTPLATVMTGGCGSCVELDYCPSVSTNSLTEWIESFHLAGVDHITGNDGGYGDHTGVPVPLLIGAPSAFSLVPGFSSVPFTEWTRIWVDLDHDGQFNDTSELLFDPPSGSTTTVNGTITIPSDATVGITRLRVSLKYQSPVPGGCTATYTFGETEDHCVDLQRVIGIEEGAGGHSGLVVFPQPADQQVVFQWVGEPRSGGSIVVFDAMGRCAAVWPVHGARNEYPVGAMATGPYQYRVLQAGTQVARGRFVIAR